MSDSVNNLKDWINEHRCSDAIRKNNDDEEE